MSRYGRSKSQLFHRHLRTVAIADANRLGLPSLRFAIRQFDAIAYTVWEEHETRKGNLGVRVSPTRGVDGDVARAVGLKRGDILLAVGGVRIRSWADVAILAPRLAVNGRYKLRILRGDEEITLTYRVQTPKQVAKARARGGAEVASVE